LETIYVIFLMFLFADDRAVPAPQHADLHAPHLAQGDRLCALIRRAHAQDLEVGHHYIYTDKKEKKIFLIYKEIQSGAVAKS